MVAQTPSLIKIQDIVARADTQHRRRLIAGRDQYLHSHLPRIIALTWRHKCGHPLSADAVKTLHLAHKRVKYEAGVTGEDLLRLLFALDAIEGEADVRAARKQAVRHINALIEQCDQLRRRAGRVDGLVERLVKYAATAATAPTTTNTAQPMEEEKENNEEEKESEESTPATAAAAASPSLSSTTAPPSPRMDVDSEHEDTDPAPDTEHQQEENGQEEEEQEEEEEQQQVANKQAPQTRATTTTAAATSSSSSNNNDDDDEHEKLLAFARQNWPRVHPQWQQQTADDGDDDDSRAVVVTLHLPRAIERDDLRLSVDHKARTITVTGVQRPPRQQQQQQQQRWADAEDDLFGRNSTDIWSMFGGFSRGQHARRAAAPSKPQLGSWFSQQLQIPAALALDKMEAVFHNGVLSLSLPRRTTVVQQQQQQQQQRRQPRQVSSQKYDSTTPVATTQTKSARRRQAKQSQQQKQQQKQLHSERVAQTAVKSARRRTAFPSPFGWSGWF